MEQEEGDEEEEKETKPDPLHQLILHFSRTALTEKRFDRSSLIERLNAEMRRKHTVTCYSWFYVQFSSLVPTSVNLIQIIFIWHMPTLWQR